ncbi:ABC transporter permease [Neorhizobium sp. NCHU2750]|uniref:ABC transporter permease n=1 Tax=Neorhizobium sp. NCHU2750 TaxID=1825976 RepID=UPI000E733DE2|nr:peptide/nickel ABC transporter permease [Neorhizobium sp. NCHU2750]
MNSIIRLLLQRVALGILTLCLIAAIIFFAVQALPGDIARGILGPEATPETLAALREQLGLNVPAYIRFGQWTMALLHGDLGKSLATKLPVSDLIGFRILNTMILAAYAALIAVPLALVLGVTSALYRDSFYDKLVSIVTLSAISMPEFFVAYTLVAIFAVYYPIFPPIAALSGDEPLATWIETLALPAITLSFAVTAHMMRMIRAAILDVMSSPYMEMAALKGISRSRRIWRHAMPNAMSPIINVIIVNLAYLIVGVVVIEVIFVYPGLGQFLVDSVSKRDLPVVQASCLIFAAIYIVLNLSADVLAIVFNPRLRYPR